MTRRTPADPPLDADLLVAGDVVTLDPACPRAEALAVRGDAIVAVGGLDELRAACRPDVPVDRPDAAAIVPGLVDAHLHLSWLGLKLLRLVPDPDAPVDAQLAALDADAFGLPWPDGAPTLEQRLEGLVRGQRLLHALGIVGVVDPAVTAPELAAYREAHRRGLLTVRVAAMPHPDPAAGPSAVATALNGLGVATGLGDETLRLGGVKVYYDGVGMAGTALRRAPWPQAPAHPDAGPHGWRRLPPEDFAAIAGACAAGGWSMGVHVVGGGGIGEVLDAWAAIDREIPLRGRGFTLIHAYLEPTAEDRARAAALGVLVAAQPSIQWVNGRGLLARLGPDAAAANPLRAWLDAGVVVAGGSDGPDFPLDPRLGLWQATTREVRDGDGPVGPEQAVTPLEALTMWTSAAHAAAGAPSPRLRGTLTPGAVADWTALSVDPLTADRDALRVARVVRTTVGGRTVHAADEALRPARSRTDIRTGATA
ncbi:amidohydrolase family protein [Patulibacter sp. S7RM1-6]